ncbi:hypothetical protein PIB30_101436 [Stylosanthes scabra]|uniref:Uncharacterized protein n=1 Tax=Stylosanthes scabra TaxID=79078 RepID=A0ABU6RXA5_9FABA|nr:hypothetical protein [Stylosanthes scabra]
MFPLAQRLSGFPHGVRDLQAGRLLSWQYRVDRCRVEDVMRQFGVDRPIPIDPVNVDSFMTTTSRGEDVWGPHITPPKHGMRAGPDTRLILSSFRLSRSQTSVEAGSIWIGGIKYARGGSCRMTTCCRIDEFWLCLRTF